MAREIRDDLVMSAYPRGAALLRDGTPPGQRAAATIVLLVVTGAAVAGASARVGTRDQIAPTFAGLKSATTCVPGPIGGQSASYTLRWNPAKDNVTPKRKIVYDIYRAATSGGEDFSSPTYTARHGVTRFTTPPLAAAKPVYFVVRARDRAGNRDSNQVERQGVNLCR